MLRTLLWAGSYVLIAPFIAIIGFPWTFLSGKVDLLYRLCMWAARTGVRVAGIKVRVEGRERLQSGRNYIFMCNHVSNVDPPIVAPLIPPRTSVLVKREVFRIPVLSRAMRMGSLVPVDRRNREAAIASLSAAGEVLRSGISMMIFPEGTRSPDGRLLPFKKGSFYLAIETGVPVVPMTILGTYEIMPKGSIAIHAGTATVIFHEPVDPAAFPSREALMEAVRQKIAAPLPAEKR
ncbi:MAG: lysophospholipid acyltransferase family protein [Terriglobales bacterium]